MDVSKLYVVGSEKFEMRSLWSKALKLYLAVVNYPPDATNGILLLSYLSNSIDKLAVETPGYKFVIGGDFNHLEASEVTENIHSTRIKTSGTRSKKCSDKIFVSNTDWFDQVETIRMSFNIDHFAVILQLKKPLKSERRKIKVRDYRNQNRQRMKLALGRHVFETLFSETDPSTATEKLMTAITLKKCMSIVQCDR